MYKSEYERINISDEDIEHLQNSIRRIINLVNEQSSNYENNADLESFIELIQKDTLKTMQLLGFNYKKAIGEPATELVASKIKNFI
ncbi:hypothetical protein [Macrococcoides caseolyticum]|uniref:hypothetical protein n=1 Tax=Macrococcoides caseolyticum TaxID=69966 RepID=UPI000C32D890|nr:hypothetical protein [Macrococcus caseolyticus]PKE62177.1 hypothetical protein CW683_11765 [Macrococcus caseolyticus]